MKLDFQYISTLFPFYLSFDKQLKVTGFGASMQKINPELREGADFNDFFKIEKPRSVQRKIEALPNSLQNIFMIRLVQGQEVVMKGQVLFLEEAEQYLFACLPVLKETGDLERLNLGFNDFALHDQTSDFLFLLQANQKGLSDMKSLSEELNIKNDTLTDISNELKANLEEIQASEEELRQNSEEMLLTNEVLEQTKAKLLDEKQKVLTQNKYILDSINYAKHLQNAVVLPKKKLLEAFPESFIIFKPKDILSGDFYWLAKKNRKSIIVLVDCMGHGVAGAFMSILGGTILNNIVKHNNVIEPDLILEEMHLELQKILEDSRKQSYDSMDVGICVIDHKNSLLEYSGAKIDLCLVQGNTIERIKGDKHPVGGYRRNDDEINRVYTKNIVKLTQKTTIYLSSDGFRDQFGGEEFKKIGRTRAAEWVEEVIGQPIEEQRKHLSQRLTDWQGNHKQTDDILFLGINCWEG